MWLVSDASHHYRALYGLSYPYNALECSDMSLQTAASPHSNALAMKKTLVTVELIDKDGHHELRYQNGNPDEALPIEVLDTLIAVLGNVRKHFVPPITSDAPTPNIGISGERNPRWQISADPMGGGAIMHFRHPGFGWMTYCVPLHEVEKMSSGLRNIAENMSGSGNQQLAN